ncbi:hypothetical protein [Methylobacterium sp. UNC300MFChir4.1]|uniref:hypothetical protein n=1 Tax=Methylobacterium sp. UNC300MFChir4.1 TaxID=1502747 RepID=UPI001113539D|nr:hypothetical protein [Methylobacterium sp. UNC300MFChir4.1]
MAFLRKRSVYQSLSVSVMTPFDVPEFPRDCHLYDYQHSSGNVIHTHCKQKIFQMPIGASGYLLYGPYVKVPAGHYVAMYAVRATRIIGRAISVMSDITVEYIPISEEKQSIIRSYSTEWELVAHKFHIHTDTGALEMRLRLPNVHEQPVMAWGQVALRRLPDRSY